MEKIYADQRNWTSLWKPTIDAMGPVLGEPNDQNPFAPGDGRIVSLASIRFLFSLSRIPARIIIISGISEIWHDLKHGEEAFEEEGVLFSFSI